MQQNHRPEVSSQNSAPGLDGMERFRRADAMMQALRAALDQVYDPDGEAQLRKLARDYCGLLGEPACTQTACSPTHSVADCPLLEAGTVEQRSDLSPSP